MKSEPAWQPEDLTNCEVVEIDEQLHASFDPTECRTDEIDFRGHKQIDPGNTLTNATAEPWTAADAPGDSGGGQRQGATLQAQVVQLNLLVPQQRQEIRLHPHPDSAVSAQQGQHVQGHLQQHQHQHQHQQHPSVQQPPSRSLKPDAAASTSRRSGTDCWVSLRLQQQQQPSTSSSASSSSRQSQQPPHKKRRKGKLLLWQFLLNDLVLSHSNLSWLEDQARNPGVFVFRDPNQAARRWGQYKENDNMSYEKMSRCIRDYWIREENKYFKVMVPDPTKGRRLHFAYNLGHKEVQQFIQTNASEHYRNLVAQGLIRTEQ